MADTTVVLSNKAYNKMKWVTMILLPAVGALYFGLGQIWGLPNGEEVVGSIAIITTFLGTVIGVSSKAYNSESSMDGYLTKTGSDPDTGIADLQLTLTKPPEEVLSHDTVRLKVEG